LYKFKNVEDFYKNYIYEQYDENGVLDFFRIIAADDFNFSYDVIDWMARIAPDRRALLWTDEAGRKREFTYGDLARYSAMAANLFLSRGIGKGDKVMLVLKRHYQFWFCLLGLIKIGAIAVPATHLLTTKDYIYRFEQAQITAIVATGTTEEVARYADEADKAVGGVLKSRFIAAGQRGDLPGWEDFDELIELQPDKIQERAETNSRDTILLYFTSGTTGYPKMVTHNHRYALAHVQTTRWQNLNSDSLHLTVADTGWAKAMWGKMFGQFTLGASVFVYDYEKFKPAEMLSVISKNKVTSFCAPPTMYRFFIKEGLENYDLSNLKYCTIAGEALNPEVFEQWKNYTGIKMMEGFGQTEATCMIANLPGMEPKPGSMGKPLPLYNMDIINDNGDSVPDGESGEIIIRAERRDDGLFAGYYMNEERTVEMWHDGIYHTGDLAWRDEDGYYWYVGRNDDVIKSSGYRIGPFEIESVLMTHPAVLECAVTGAPDPTRGQVVKATIILAKGYVKSPELAKELQNHVKHNTAPYKYPRVVEFVEELPKTISGKIRRAQIREQDQEQK
jgi:acetyl-CoA synthetase